jgi:hypothetical protein
MLHQAFIEAGQAYQAAYERLQEETDEARLGPLQAIYDAALARVDAAKAALLESDDPRPWDFAEDEGGHFLTVTLRPSEVEERLRKETAGGDYGEVTKTIWTEGYAHCEDTGESFTVEVSIQPKAPSCTGDEHDWKSPEFLGGLKENPGVFGHGGGVRIHECCMHCGCEKVTDTWAQNPANGKQGLTSVSYEERKYVEELEIAAAEA